MDKIKPVAFAFKQDWARFNSDNQECRLLPNFYWGKNLAEDDSYEPLYDQYAIDDLLADAMRYRWLCDGNGYFMEDNYLCGHENEKDLADSAIDKAMRDKSK